MDYVDPAAPSDTTDWYKVWAAAMSVETMCVDRGYAGVALGVGESASFSSKVRGSGVLGFRDHELWT